MGTLYYLVNEQKKAVLEVGKAPLLPLPLNAPAEFRLGNTFDEQRALYLTDFSSQEIRRIQAWLHEFGPAVYVSDETWDFPPWEDYSLGLDVTPKPDGKCLPDWNCRILYRMPPHSIYRREGWQEQPDVPAPPLLLRIQFRLISWASVVLVFVGQCFRTVRYHLWVLPRFYLMSWLRPLLYVHETVWRQTGDVGNVAMLSTSTGELRENSAKGKTTYFPSFPPVPPSTYLVVESVKVQERELLMGPLLPEIMQPGSWVNPTGFAGIAILVPGMEYGEMRMDWAQATVACIRVVGPWERVERVVRRFLWRATA